MTPLRPAVEMSDALGCDRYAAVRAPVPPSDCLSQLDFGHFCSLKKQQQTAYAEENIFSPRRLSNADPACRVVPPDGRVCPVVLQASVGARQSLGGQRDSRPWQTHGHGVLEGHGVESRAGFRQRSYWIPGSSAFTDFEHRSTFLM